MDQSLFGYAIPGIRAEFGSSYGDISWVLTVSFIFAALSSAAIGILADRFGRRTLFVFCLVASAALVGLHAFVTGLVTLTILRMLAFGLSNGLSPITNAFTAEAAPARFRGLLVGLLQVGYPLGWFVASLLVAPIIANFGWRYVFLPALLVIPIAFLIVRRLPESEHFQKTRAKAVSAGTASKARFPIKKNLKELFGPELRRRSITCMVAFFMFGGAYAGTAFFFPSYFHDFRGYPMETATWIVGTAYLVGALGYIAVAFLGEFVFTRRNMCMLWNWFGALALIGLVWLPTSKLEDIFWFGLMAGFFYGSAAALSMFFIEIFPTRVRATAAGLCASFSMNIGHALFPPLVAAGIETIGWQWAFTLAVVPPMTICGLAVWSLPSTRAGLDLEEVSEVYK